MPSTEAGKPDHVQGAIARHLLQKAGGIESSTQHSALSTPTLEKNRGCGFKLCN
ncbi:hypothetical protein LC593_05235 [Nostoc sp. CHAB 5844]|nr:hypothetical protein [Nostoc sp. CHAB 5844]